MCHKNAQVEGHRKALGIARNPDAHVADESCFVAVLGGGDQLGRCGFLVLVFWWFWLCGGMGVF